jgi:hypothetical protein
MMENRGLRLALKGYAEKIKEVGGTPSFSDYGLSLAADFGDKGGFWVCKQSRPERDGHERCQIITKERFDILLGEINAN